MKQIKISNIPARLALMIILVFGIVPAVGFTLYHYQNLSRGIAEGEARALEALRQEVKREIDSDISLFNSFTAIGRTRMRQYVKATSETIYDMMCHMYRRHGDSLPPKAVSDLIREHIRGIRLFGGRGYFFAYALDGTLELYPPDMALEGSQWFDMKDADGRKIVQEIIQVARNKGEGFVEYLWPFPGKKEINKKKIAYVKLFPPLGWVVGTGDYLEASAKEIQTYVLEGNRQQNRERDGEFFIFDRQMKQLSGRPDHQGRMLPDDALRTVLVEGQRRILEGKGDFIAFSRLEKAGEAPKSMMGYARYYPPWGWTVGKVVDSKIHKQRARKLQRKVKQEIIDDLVAILSINGFAIFFVFLAGRLYSNRLEKNLREFEFFFSKAGKAMEQIDLEQVHFHELKGLGKMANVMVSQREKSQQAIHKINIKLRDANRKLKDMANLDGLTHIANRRSFDIALGREWKRALREGHPVALAMLDIDFFKQYNDTYGHQKGDQCLVSIAAALKGAARRPGDIAARYGGEEFVILLPNTDLAGGKKIAEDLRRKIAALEIPHSQSPLGRISFSLGLAAEIPRQDMAVSTLVKQADQALYRAKEKGRDRIESASSQR
ncbi:MAG: cache domain-containing protein [Desulfobacter sp.]|nr:MAG: cache domain-containing protein [Desulfobacter sp.]